MPQLRGVRTIVTGAGSGIGRAIVRRFVSEGAQVVAVVRRSTDRASLQADGAVVVEGDVSRYETSAEAVAAAEQHFGGLDVFVANAGLWDFHKRIEKQSPEELQRAATEIFGVNVMGNTIRRSRGGGSATPFQGCAHRHRLQCQFSRRRRRLPVYRIEIRAAGRHHAIGERTGARHSGERRRPRGDRHGDLRARVARATGKRNERRPAAHGRDGTAHSAGLRFPAGRSHRVVRAARIPRELTVYHGYDAGE